MMDKATYTPEDNKLRLYVGRVPRDEYLALRKAGWTSTPKQDCDFAATWRTSREETAIEYAESGIIEDEDYSTEDRAADRAERFAGYREKRRDDAGTYADAYDAGPSVHGYQNKGKAVRAANRHDRKADHATDNWSKAEYWQERTAGVIAHALYASKPGVRMGRIKKIESELRKAEKGYKEYKDSFDRWTFAGKMEDGEKKDKAVKYLSYITHGDYTHPRTGRKSYLYDFIDNDRETDTLTSSEICALWLENAPEPITETRYSNHLKLRLAYENQMLEAQGGRAAHVEMEAGGFIGGHQIQKVNKSTVTGRVVSVSVWGETGLLYTEESGYKKRESRSCLVNIKTERLEKETYRAPTEAEKAAFLAEKKAIKKSKPKVSFINPTHEDAKRLQAVWNEEAEEANKGRNYSRKASEIYECTQAKYSDMYKDYKTTDVYNGVKLRICQIGWRNVRQVVVLTDKKQKPFPSSIWETKKETVKGQQAEMFEEVTA